MRTFTKTFFLGAAASFFGLLALAEILLRMTVPTGFWYRHFDLSGDMTSLPEIRDRIRYGAPQKDRILLLGDSVLGASALMEHRIPDARQKTLRSVLRGLLGDRPTLSLGSDGLLLTDIEGLSAEFSATPPGEILLLLNFRMFSKEFAGGPKALSRQFLLGDLPEDIQKRLASDRAPGEEARLSDALYDGLCGHWFLFRETQMAKTLWYYPSQQDFFQRQLEKVVPANEVLSEIVEASLKQKVASYYQAHTWDPKGLPFTCLRQVLDQWSAAHIPVRVVLTPQNPPFLGSYLDKPSFSKNRKALAAFMKPYLKKGITYQDWADRYPPSSFLDHCHMTPEGNRRYAGDLVTVLSGRAR
ncbi:MAG TPA: hypothetical protein VHE12_04255 [bacterium]|nr:hypothetical protein [bacterium]